MLSPDQQSVVDSLLQAYQPTPAQRRFTLRYPQTNPALVKQIGKEYLPNYVRYPLKVMALLANIMLNAGMFATFYIGYTTYIAPIF